MANQATINPNPNQKIVRSVGRIKTLKDAIEKAQARGQSDRVNSLNDELNRRTNELQSLKAEIDKVI